MKLGFNLAHLIVSWFRFLVSAVVRSMVVLECVSPSHVLGSSPTVGAWVIRLAIGWIGGWLGLLVPFRIAGALRACWWLLCFMCS
jgi:hypothetical protein